MEQLNMTNIQNKNLSHCWRVLLFCVIRENRKTNIYLNTLQKEISGITIDKAFEICKINNYKPSVEMLNVLRKLEHMEANY